MPSNNTGRVVKQLFQDHPGKIALLLNPHRIYKTLFDGKYAVDNAAFNRFDESAFFKLLDACPKENPPMFIVCPDVVGCHCRTLALWHYYYPKIKPYGFPIAFVAQDGCTPETVPSECDWIFIGGTNGWKSKNIKPYIGMRPVHVGRVNSIGFAAFCEKLGATSADGTGWMRSCGGKKTGQKNLLKWFNEYNGEVQLGLPTS